MRLQQLERWERLISNARLIVGLGTGVFLWVTFVLRLVSLFWLLFPLLCFTALVIVHERNKRKTVSAKNAVRFYTSGLKRIQDEWSGEGNPGFEFFIKSHLYSEALDLFGEGSLFQLLSIARTHAGETTLAAWLSTTSPRGIIEARQAAVAEMRSSLDFREDMARLGEEIRATVRTDVLMRWAETPPILYAPAARAIAPILVGLTVVTFVGLASGSGSAPFWAALFLEGGFGLIYWKRVQQVVNQIERPAHHLELLSKLVERIEKEEFTSPKLKTVQARLHSGGERASHQIARLSRLVERLDDRHNLIFRPLSYFLLWTTQFAFAIEAWRSRCGPAVEEWLDAIGEIEALSCLSAYAYEHPADPFPEIADDEPCFSAMDLGHPLIPEQRSVRNSIRLDRKLQLVVVSGSNMSGKTTLLRTVGVNAVLAMAGAPVRARSLRLSPLMIGATLGVHDSLQEGKSRFYAEILRLREILELTRTSDRVLFLLDEILHGTNSHDRLIGAQSVIRSLIENGAIGLVTTHDLALTKMVESLPDRAINVHFQDRMVDGEIVFDYQLHPGVVRKSNALELMRSIGLEV